MRIPPAGNGRRNARLALYPVAAGFAVVTLAVARAHPGGAFAGSSLLGAAIELGGALALSGAGLLFWASRPGNRVGPLLVLAGAAWLLPEWSNPEAGFAPMFTLGLTGFFACAPLVVHLALAYPSGRVARRSERAAVALAYCGGIGVLGVVPNLFFDPQATGCGDCPRNLVLIHGNASLSEDLSRFGIRMAIGWTILALVVVALRALRSSLPALRATGPVLAAAGAYLAFTTVELWHSVGRGFLGTDADDVRLWKAEGVALLLIAAAVAWALVRARRTRTSVAQFVVELGHAPRVGGARETLATVLRDPDLELAYRRAASEGYVDIGGEPVDPAPSSGRAATPLIREGREIAVVIHDEDLLSDRGVLEDAIAAARIAVENEQLQAEVRAQMNEIRASRSRIVEAADAERKRLERDLHDGAQQRLVALSLALRLVRNEAERGDAGAALPLLDEADAVLRQGLAELRDVAHGIYPAVLTDEGLAAALETLAERSPDGVRLRRVPEERFPPAVEAAAYFAAAELIRDPRAGDGGAQIDVVREDGRLIVEVDGARALDGADARLIEIADRVGALDGALEVQERPDGRLRMEAHIPCA